jgi:hypothetical protein
MITRAPDLHRSLARLQNLQNCVIRDAGKASIEPSCLLYFVRSLKPEYEAVQDGNWHNRGNRTSMSPANRSVRCVRACNSQWCIATLD